VNVGCKLKITLNYIMKIRNFIYQYDFFFFLKKMANSYVVIVHRYKRRGEYLRPDIQNSSFNGTRMLQAKRKKIQKTPLFYVMNTNM
jgi:hypothetical protein